MPSLHPPKYPHRVPDDAAEQFCLSLHRGSAFVVIKLDRVDNKTLLSRMPEDSFFLPKTLLSLPPAKREEEMKTSST